MAASNPCDPKNRVLKRRVIETGVPIKTVVRKNVHGSDKHPELSGALAIPANLQPRSGRDVSLAGAVACPLPRARAVLGIRGGLQDWSFKVWGVKLGPGCRRPVGGFIG